MPASILPAAALLRAAATLLNEAQDDGLAPVCLAVCNRDGQLGLFLRMDAAPVRLIAIAQAKAYSAARLGVSTADFARRLVRDGLTTSDFCDSGLTAMRGGVPLLRDGQVLLGLGISGRSTDADEALALRLRDLLTEELARAEGPQGEALA